MRRRARARAGYALAIVATLAARPAVAQSSGIAPELRADAVAARRTSFQLGAGAFVAAGGNLRLGVIAAADPGVTTPRASRVDGVARFHLDPYRARRWGIYGASGVGVRWVDGERGRPYLIAIVGLDGPAHGGVAPAVELGLGGGTRVGVALRRARAGVR